MSGGVDSMALAALCSHLHQSPLQPPFFGLPPEIKSISFRAFVVDHGARQGSDLEANAVSKVLEQRGIDTQVLKIDWANQKNPAILPNFETVARKARFQALGKACRDAGIYALLLAHHQDDQAETVLMRLLAGQRSTGLAGIKCSSELPECRGIHGVHESGVLPEYADEWYPRPTSKANSIWQGPKCESGGVNVYRPFLCFGKDRLIATCEAEKIPWFEDHTNLDPTVTTRNAIRHMYKSFTMPTALMKPALLKLADTWAARDEDARRIAKERLAECDIKSFDTRSGILTFRFPDLAGFRKGSGIIAAHILRRVMMLLAPKEWIEIRSLHGAVKRIFPELFGEDKLSPTNFTVSKLLFKPLLSTWPSGEAQKPIWLISREPYLGATLRSMQLSILPSTNLPWTLYDNRYWFKIQNLHPTSSFILRPFRDGGSDTASFKEVFEKHFLNELLRDIAPGIVRWTLPALVLREEGGEERVVALPTLNISLPEIEGLVRWKVRYKKVNLDGFRDDQA